MDKLVLCKVLKEDCDILFQWANDQSVRQNSFLTKPIPYEEHIVWFEKKLLDENCRMYILKYNGEPAGQIRVDIVDGIGKISYSIASQYRGRGCGYRILELIEKECKDLKELYGEVKKENIASSKCFEKNGYQCREQEGSYLYKKICDNNI